jgi:hypothetical protein
MFKPHRANRILSERERSSEYRLSNVSISISLSAVNVRIKIKDSLQVSEGHGAACRPKQGVRSILLVCNLAVTSQLLRQTGGNTHLRGADKNSYYNIEVY